MKNCTCKGGFNGYIDFGDAEFYRNEECFDFNEWWKVAAVIADAPVVLSFIVALLLWVPLRALWKDSKPIVSVDGGEEEEEGVTLLDQDGKADMYWIAY